MLTGHTLWTKPEYSRDAPVARGPGGVPLWVGSWEPSLKHCQLGGAAKNKGRGMRRARWCATGHPAVTSRGHVRAAGGGPADSPPTRRQDGARRGDRSWGWWGTRNRDNAVCREPLTGHTPLARVHALLVLLGAGLPPGVRARGCVFPRSSWRFGFPTPETTSFTSSCDSNSSWAAKKLIYL